MAIMTLALKTDKEYLRGHVMASIYVMVNTGGLRGHEFQPCDWPANSSPVIGRRIPAV